MPIWLGQSWQVRKLTKMFESVHVIKAFVDYSAIYWVIEDFILYQINQLASKSGYYFTNYDKFRGNCWFEELQNRKHVLPF